MEARYVAVDLPTIWVWNLTERARRIPKVVVLTSHDNGSVVHGEKASISESKRRMHRTTLQTTRTFRYVMPKLAYYFGD
jgi:hypothetical protein